MPIGLEQWRMQIGALEAQRYRYLSRAVRKAARSGRVRVGRISGGCVVGMVLCVTLLCLATSFSMRLLLAGDVERNPGPLPDELLSAVDNSELVADDLRAVYKEVHSLAGRWRAMCLSLGLSDSEMEITAATYPTNPHDCFREVILKWLKKTYNFQRYGPPTWRMIVEAVADPAGGNNTALAEKIAKAHQAAMASPPTHSSLQAAVGSPGHITTPAQWQKQPDAPETHDLCRKFSETFENITSILDKSVRVRELKKFLNHYSHPLYPEQRLIDPKVYRDAQTTEDLLEELFPQFINYMNYFLLEDIIERFRSDEARRLLQEYTGQLPDSRKRKLSTFPDPITDEEAEQFAGVKKAKVTVQGDLEHTIVEYLEEIKQALEKATGIPKVFITYSSQDPGSVILYFLIPEVICHIFHDLGVEDLTVLADSGVTRLEIDELVIENIQSYATQKTSTAEVESSSEDTKRGSLEYYLKQRKTEIGSDKHSHLLRMLKSVPPSELQKECSKTFLAHFADSLKEWKKLAPYFGINEWHYEELEEHYPDERDQNYQALLCWRRMEGDTATYYNLLQTLLLHGDIEEVEALLRGMELDPAVLHVSELLKQKYLDCDSWHAWRDVPNLMEFDQRLGVFTEDAPEMLKTLDYADCPETMDQYPSLVTPVSPKSLIASIDSRKGPVFLVKGLPSHGKSYLLGKVCQYWAKGFGLRMVTLVLWMNLECLNTTIYSLEGLLAQVIPGDIVKDVCSWVLTRNGKDVLFLLDGWCHVEQTSILYKLVSRQYLKESTVVVASTFTPEPMLENRWMSTKQCIQWEMMGLTYTQISKQIIRYHGLNPTRAEELLQCLASNPDMQLLSHTPVNLYAILFVSQNIPPSNHNFPRSKTQFFMTLTVLLLQQAFPEHQLLPHLSSLHTCYSEDHLPPPMHTFLEKLSLTAMYMLGLRESDVDKESRRQTGFTFLQYCHEPSFASKKLVRFAFPGLRDFLAALCIHHLPEVGQLGRIEATEELMKKKAFPWSFYAGLCKYEHLSVLLSLLEKHCGDDLKKLASCAYEANAIVNIPNRIRGCILTIAHTHHIIAAFRDIHEMIFDNCCLGTDASVQLSKLNRYFHPMLPATGYSDHHLQFLECVFSEEGLDYLRMTTVEEIRLYGLSMNQLQAFSSRRGEHLGPRSLNLTNNGIQSSGARALAKGLCHNNSLQELDLSDNRIEDEGATAHSEALRVNQTLRNLNLSFNRIGSKGASTLSEALRVNHTLRNLNLSGNVIGDKAATTLTEALRVNHTLRNLNLSGNVIGDKGATTLTEALRVNHTLRNLNLADNVIHDSGARALAEGLCHNNSLQELDLSDNRIEDEGATALSEALRVNQTLRNLNLSGNEIGGKGATALSEALRVNHTLRSLNLSGNEIGDEGATALSEALRVNHTLRTLNLSHNDIADEGATALSKALRVNHTLRTFNLADNVIHDSGAQALAGGLCHNNSLQELDLSDNRIEDERATALSEALRVNHTLRTLNLANNEIHDSGAQALAKGLLHNNSLQELDLSDNRIEDEGATVLSEALRVNQTLRNLNLSQGLGPWKVSPEHPIWSKHQGRFGQNTRVILRYMY